MDKDYYKIIGLTREAGQEEIRKAYHALAMKYHPDRNGDDPEGEERLKELNEAYRVLGNLEKRRLYDFYRRSSGADAVRIQDLDEVLAFQKSFAVRRGGCRGRGMGMMGCRRRK